MATSFKNLCLHQDECELIPDGEPSRDLGEWCDHLSPNDYIWNVMAHAQKLDFVFRRKRRVHLNRRVHHFSWILTTEVCASAAVILDTPCSGVVWRVLAPTPFASFPFTSPPVRHRVTSQFNWTLTLLRKVNQKLQRFAFRGAAIEALRNPALSQ
jgi:hypothetical protein